MTTTRTSAVALFVLILVGFVTLQAQSTPEGRDAPTTGFSLTIYVDHEAVRADSLWLVKVKQKNDTDHLINNSFGGLPCHFYRMEVLKDGVQVPKTRFMLQEETPNEDVAPGTVKVQVGHMMFSDLKPGEEQEFHVNAASCYEMEEPGDYQVTLTWERVDPKDRGKVIQTRSNTITVTVVPPIPPVEEPK